MHDKLRALLTLFILQIMALVSISMGHEVSICLPLMVQLTPLFSHCGLSYLGCITGTDVDKTKGILFEECVEEEYVNEMSCFSLARHGACLVVIWGHISNAVSESAKRDLSDLKNTLRINQEQRWQSIVTLKNIFSCSDLPWELKKQGMDFLLGITESGGASAGSTKEPVDSSHYITSLYGALQSIEILMMSAPDAALRKNAYEAMKRILADITPSHRLDVMKALITSSRASSMTALLINLVREEMHKEQKRVNGEISPGENGTFWSNSGILEIVENVLRPQGGPPSVLEDSDAVLSALNLYRYILLTEHNGKSNRTGVLSETNLRRAYDEWLLPLRTLVTALMADDDVSVEYSCGLNPLELVLYRCIELVEEQLKNP
uniref:Aberrant root formation protein 4 n=1 Tax=Kalanchoe fedtschenkoi TaxID=63787 RepID=A0A7N0UU61_KALFE